MTTQNQTNRQMGRNWLGGQKIPLIRTLLVGLPTIIGGYLGWRHGSEFCDYVNAMTQNSDIFYHQVAASVPLLVKLTGAYLEGKIFKKTGQFVSGICEKSSENLTYNTENTRSLNESFDPKRPYNYYATLGRAEYESFVQSFILNARKTGKFKAMHLDAAREKIGKDDLEEMVRDEYVIEETKLGIPVVSPTYKALKLMFGTDKKHEAVQGPFGYFEGKNIEEQSRSL